MASGSSGEKRLTASSIIRWLELALTALEDHADLLNSLNVFPVADSDTGSNMTATLAGAQRAVAQLDDSQNDPIRVMVVAARGALATARGNSGVILSEWLRGFSVGLTRNLRLDDALDQAATTATAAVVDPAPGTILTAAREAANAARRSAEQGGKIGQIADAALEAARMATVKSPNLLAALQQAGVVDSGSAGLVLILAALRAAIYGDSLSAVGLGIETHLRPVSPDQQTSPLGGTEDGFELMFTISASNQLEVAVLREELARIGNSVVVVGGEAPIVELGAQWHAHVHVNDIVPALELIEKWKTKYSIGSLQVRHLDAPATEPSLWVSSDDPYFISEFASAGAAVFVTSSTIADQIAAAIEASVCESNLVILDPSQADLVRARLSDSQDFVVAAANDDVKASILIAVIDFDSESARIALSKTLSNQTLIDKPLDEP